MNPLPPQAFTKDTLIQAYAWLQDQNDHVKEMAKSPDILVGLYLKAKHNGVEALERPSIQNFKNELKSLAGIMQDFETKNPPPQSSVVNHGPTVSGGIIRSPEPASIPLPTHTHLPDLFSNLDSKTKTQIEEIKSDLNISSSEEALRLLVSVGYRALKKL